MQPNERVFQQYNTLYNFTGKFKFNQSKLNSIFTWQGEYLKKDGNHFSVNAEQESSKSAM